MNGLITFEVGDTILFTARGRQRRGLVNAVWTCCTDGTPTEFEPDETRYFVTECDDAGNMLPCGWQLVLPGDNPALLHKPLPVCECPASTEQNLI